VFLGPVESGSFVTTIAAESDNFGAVNELLLRERDKLARFDLVSTLKSTGGGEGPAGTALALILNGGDSTFVSPVDGGVGAAGSERLGRLGELHGGKIAVHLGPLRLGLGGVSVVSKSERVALGVLSLDLGINLGKDGLAEHVFLNVLEGLVELDNVFHELAVNGVSGGNKGEGSSDKGFHL